jgi:citrate lyase beta subunit
VGASTVHALSAGSRGASAGIDLLDVPYLNLDDPEGLRAEAQGCARLGFTGKASIHPNQLAIIHEAFTPTRRADCACTQCVAAFEQSPSGWWWSTMN